MTLPLKTYIVIYFPLKSPLVVLISSAPEQEIENCISPNAETLLLMMNEPFVWFHHSKSVSK